MQGLLYLFVVQRPYLRCFLTFMKFGSSYLGNGAFLMSIMVEFRQTYPKINMKTDLRWTQYISISTIFLIWVQTRDRMVFGFFLIWQPCLNHSANLPPSVRIQGFIFFRSPSSDWRQLKKLKRVCLSNKKGRNHIMPYLKKVMLTHKPRLVFLFNPKRRHIYFFRPFEKLGDLEPETRRRTTLGPNVWAAFVAVKAFESKH